MRPQFSLKTLLWLIVVAAAFCAGMQLDRHLKDRSDVNQAYIRKALDQNTELDFAEKPLTDVIDFFKRRHQIEIQIDNKALAEAGIPSNTPITRFVKGIPLRSGLNMILSDLDLTYVIQNGVLTITTNASAGNPQLNSKTVMWGMVAAAVVLGSFLFGRACGRRPQPAANNSQN